MFRPGPGCGGSPPVVNKPQNLLTCTALSLETRLKLKQKSRSVPFQRGGWWSCQAWRESSRWSGMRRKSTFSPHTSFWLRQIWLLEPLMCVLPCVRPSPSIPQRTGWCWWASAPPPCSGSPAGTHTVGSVTYCCVRYQFNNLCSCLFHLNAAFLVKIYCK